MRLQIAGIGHIVLLSGSLFFLGCHGPTAPLTEKDVATHYSASADWGRSDLDLHPDHTFDQVVVRNDGTRTQIHGTWKLEYPVAGDSRLGGLIIFEPFLSVTSENQGKWVGGNLPGIDREDDNSIEISADPDHGISFYSK